MNRLARSPATRLLFNQRSFVQCTKLSICNLPINKNQITLYRTYSTAPQEPKNDAAPQLNVENKIQNNQEEIQITQQREPIPTAVKILGFSGLLPMIAGAYGAVYFTASQASLAVFYQMSYGSVLLSFMGAVHWGLAMAEYSSVAKLKEDGGYLLKPTNAQQVARYTLSVVPCLYAWGLQAFPPEIAMSGMLIGFAGQLVADFAADKHGLVPSWYIKLRVPLTIGVLLSLGVTYLVLGTNKPL